MTLESQTAVERLADEIERGYRGDPWHGSSTREVLAGVDAATAARRLIPSAHTIGEIVAHLTAWTREIARRLGGSEPGSPPEGDWPRAAGLDEGEWGRALAELDRAHSELLSALRRFPAADLERPVGRGRDQAVGTGLSFEQTLHGLSQHLAYHTGQIALLKKLG
jgi:hypothetical protein